MSAAGIASRLGGQRQGHNWRVPSCPRGCGYSLSLSDGEDGRLLAFCFGGCTFDEIMLALVEYGLLDGDDADLSAPQGDRFVPFRNDADQRRRKIQQAREFYAEQRLGRADQNLSGQPLDQAHFAGIEISANTRRTGLGPACRAMLAPVVDVDGEQTGVHMTYLRRDGGGKADLPKEFQRECRGVIHGGAIRLMEHDPGVELGLAEGVETGLSFVELFDLPCWSAVYAGGLRSLVLPPDVRRIIIAADNDVSGVGQRNALAAYDRWTAEGREVRIK